MNQNRASRADAVELNIGQILKLLLRSWWVVALCCIVTAAVTFGASKYLIRPEYSASVLFYVNNLSFAEDSRLSGSDMDASKRLVDTYMVILHTNQSLDQAIREAELSLTASEAAEMINARTVEQTELFRVTVTGPDADTVGRLAKAIESVFPERVGEIMAGSAVSVAEPSSTPNRPSSPNVMRNTLSGCLFGVVFGCSLVLLRGLFDVSIREESDLTCVGDIPLLARIPKLAVTAATRMRPKEREAYKSLRTKLEYAMANTVGCRVVGVCSAMAGEGKSTSAANLACTLSQRGKRVLLMDCDLRRPSLHEKLLIAVKPGLSEYLSNQAALEEVMQQCVIRNTAFWSISAGRIPPNPGELLSSRRMEELVGQLRKVFDYIIVDLPPVGEVSDALTVTKYSDGILMVVRRNYCSSLKLRSAVQQFEAIGARILGILLNCAEM